MSEQIDIAVDLGVVPPSLPEIEFLREFVANVLGGCLNVLKSGLFSVN
jgi:hypothetical protein